MIDIRCGDDAVFAYAPESRTFIEADLATPANGFSFWAEAYEDNRQNHAACEAPESGSVGAPQRVEKNPYNE